MLRPFVYSVECVACSSVAYRNKLQLFPVILILNIFQSYAAVCIRCHSPDYVNFNNHRLGNILTANSNSRLRFSILLTQYCAGDKIEKNEVGGACSAYGGGVYRVVMGIPEVKKPVGRTRHRWEDNIKMDLQEVECGGMSWSELAQGRDRWGHL
jgi:hypothetical protein